MIIDPLGKVELETEPSRDDSALLAVPEKEFLAPHVLDVGVDTPKMSDVVHDVICLGTCTQERAKNSNVERSCIL